MENKTKVMSVKEFREEYNIGHNKAYEIIHCKGFPCIFIGRKCLIIRSKVDEWLEGNLGKKL